MDKQKIINFVKFYVYLNKFDVLEIVDIKNHLDKMINKLHEINFSVDSFVSIIKIVRNTCFDKFNVDNYIKRLSEIKDLPKRELFLIQDLIDMK